MHYRYLDTPIGDLLLAGVGEALCEIGFPSGPKRRRAAPDWEHKPRSLPEAAAQLGEYFRGERKSFELELQPAGTPFQLAVLETLKKIPYGETVTYGEIAKRMGKPKAVRAVGAANGANPIPIVIPCHRVIGSDGKLTGFGGGLDIKAALLRLELGNSGLFAK